MRPTNQGLSFDTREESRSSDDKRKAHRDFQSPEEAGELLKNPDIPTKTISNLLLFHSHSSFISH
jgi:hypothetical protein